MKNFAQDEKSSEPLMREHLGNGSEKSKQGMIRAGGDQPGYLSAI